LQAPVEYFRQLMTPEVMASPGVRCYVGELHGEPVTTGLGVVLDESVGIFNVATLPAHQRNGYGAMVTATAVAEGLADGAQWAWLQSSPAGHRVYERLGFRTVATWECWVTTD
jgi:N-acetylglutamate synthase